MRETHLASASNAFEEASRFTSPIASALNVPPEPPSTASYWDEIPLKRAFGP